MTVPSGLGSNNMSAPDEDKDINMFAGYAVKSRLNYNRNLSFCCSGDYVLP